jgi:hypothetical protein
MRFKKKSCKIEKFTKKLFKDLKSKLYIKKYLTFNHI